MKKRGNRRTAFVLAAALLLSAAAVLFAACGAKKPAESGSETEGKPGVEADGVFKVGYARENITPEESGYPLGGYGRSETRLSNGFLDYCYTTCVAFEDGTGTRFLMITTDIISAGKYSADLKEKITELTGIPEENMLVTATHTHSQVDFGQANTMPLVEAYRQKLMEGTVKAVSEALADAKPAKLFWNTVDLKGYNFVRHYFDANNNAIGDNHNSSSDWNVGDPVRHTTEANTIMYLVRVDREDGKPILLSNWRAHPTITGGSTKTNISSDYVGYIRSEIEKAEDCLFAYFQGEAGNMNPRTRLDDEVEKNPPADVKKYGKETAALIQTAYESDAWEEVAAGPIYTIHDLYEADINHTKDALVSVAQQIRAEWSAHGWTGEVTRMLQENGLYSPYQCNAITSNANKPLKETDSLHATAIGDLILTNEESEMFDTNGTFVRDNSPSKYTIVMSYTDNNGYIPSQFAYVYGCYESDTSRFAPGTGEILASRLVEMAKEVWSKNHQ